MVDAEVAEAGGGRSLSAPSRRQQGTLVGTASMLGRGARAGGGGVVYRGTLQWASGRGILGISGRQLETKWTYIGQQLNLPWQIHPHAGLFSIWEETVVFGQIWLLVL